MKAIVLAGGYAKRLWPLTKDIPKPLLTVGGKPIIDHIMEKLCKIKEIDSIIISTNTKFGPHFDEWNNTACFGDHVEIFTEQSTSEENKIGAIGALGLVMKEKDINDDVIVIAGDNLFDFSLSDFISSGKTGAPKVALYDMKDKALVSNYGVVVIDDDNIIREFHEKPEDPPSTLISTGCYFFPRGIAHKIHEYLNDGQNPDAPGFFISWLADHIDIHGFVFGEDSRWFDIGSIESYELANKIFQNNEKS